MPRTATQLAELKESRREQILAAALMVFGDKGVAAAQMSHVAKAAGVSKGTLYWYFDSKRELVQALLQSELDEFLATARGAGSGEDPGASMAAMLRRVFDNFAHRPQAMRFLLRMFIDDDLAELVGVSTADAFEVVRAEVVKILGRFQQTGAISDDVDLRSLASLIMAVGDGLALQLLADPSSVDIGATTALLLGITQTWSS